MIKRRPGTAVPLRTNESSKIKPSKSRGMLKYLEFMGLLVVALTLIHFATHYFYDSPSTVLEPITAATTVSGSNAIDKPRVAIMVSITNETDPKYTDLLSALSQSVVEMEQAGSKYQFEMVAVIRPGFHLCIPALKAYNFKILEKDVPVSLESIAPGAYNNHVAKSGCCGLAEFMKLHAFTLTEYYRVVHLDSDVLVTGNFDELLDMDKELVFTNSTLQGEALSGGVIIVKPSMENFQAIIDIVNEGDFRYDGSGWRGSGIGYSWGGETIQGVLPYYFLGFRKGEVSFRADRCIYNNQGSDLCKDIPLSKVKIVHMTVCQKPWICSRMGHIKICEDIHDLWWKFNYDMLDSIGVERNPRCNRWDPKNSPVKYVPINLSDRVL